MDANSEKGDSGYVGCGVEGNSANASIADQIRTLEEFAAETGLLVVSSYVDQARSGLNMEWSALEQFLAAAQSGQGSFGVVLVWEPGKLSRNPHHAATIASLLREGDVRSVLMS